MSIDTNWLDFVNSKCQTKRKSNYISKPIKEKEIKYVYRNEFFNIETNNYFRGGK